MNKENDILQELKEMGSALGSISRTMPFSFPDGYFDKLPEEITGIINDLNQPEAIPAWGKQLPYNVPQGYFENLGTDVLAGIQAENTANNLPKNIPFGVPQGYFDGLSAQVLDKIKAENTPLKQIDIAPKKRVAIFKPMKWAAAAVLLIGIGVGSYKTVFRQQTVNSEKILASVPSNDIEDYLQHIYRMDIDKVVKNTDINNIQVDNKDIIAYLNENGWDGVE